MYRKTPDGNVTINNPTEYLLGYLESQGVIMPKDALVKEMFQNQETQNVVGHQVQPNIQTPVSNVNVYQRQMTNTLQNTTQTNQIPQNMTTNTIQNIPNYITQPVNNITQ